VILKCMDCGEKIDTTTIKANLVKIGNSYKCIRCRGFKFVIEEIDTEEKL
jgi:DNA-directed RNA polymerase subunit RPC12/RpoP